MNDDPSAYFPPVFGRPEQYPTVTALLTQVRLCLEQCTFDTVQPATKRAFVWMADAYTAAAIKRLTGE